ncbi:MAG: NTP transferase domain-containing protein [Myxococcota bacterium]
MRAIILSAGQGRRLLPLTTSTPKCLLPVDCGRSVLEVQLRALARCGISEVTVMVGFGAPEVERTIAELDIPGLSVDTFFNPFYKLTDNLVTVWLAQQVVDGDFLLLNGDTLFDAPVLERLLAAPPSPLTLAVNEKDGYDADDMKVSLVRGGQLRAVGKTLDLDVVDCESIGLMLFRGDGVAAFRSALDRAVRDENALGAWYLSVINTLADEIPIQTAAITGLWWGEVDSPEDLEGVRAFFDARERKRLARANARL